MLLTCKRLLRSGTYLAAVLSLAVPAVSLIHGPSYALSELKEEAPAAQDTSEDQAQQAEPEEENEPAQEGNGAVGIPMPDPLVNPSAATTAQTVGDVMENATIETDVEKAPAPVKRMRQLLIDAAKTGDIEKLRPLINQGLRQARIDGVEDENQDPIAVLKEYSGDADGQEILAIILDLLNSSYAHVDAGTEEEAYVWPYFAAKPLSALTAPERVELLRIITAGDLADMEQYGNYSFYRLGITKDGEWKFFTSGD